MKAPTIWKIWCVLIEYIDIRISIKPLANDPTYYYKVDALAPKSANLNVPYYSAKMSYQMIPQ